MLQEKQIITIIMMTNTLVTVRFMMIFVNAILQYFGG